jgi:threonine/homoserine/homoserine lactone efflux protein
MMLHDLFLKSAAVGLAVAAPVGPMSLLCMRRTLTGGWRGGLPIGLGIAAGDAAYGAIAALGLAGVSAAMVAWRQPLHLAAGLVLLWFGLRAMWNARRTAERDAKGPSLSGAPVRLFAGSVLLTLTNPMTIVMFAAVFAALSPPGGLTPSGAAATVAGVFAGSLLWWCAVVGLVSLFRRAVGLAARIWIDRISGGLLAGFGLLELRRAV